MWLLRLLAVGVVIGVGVGVALYAVTGDRRYLAFSWRLGKAALIFAFLVMALFALERLAIIPA